jgi:transposase
MKPEWIDLLPADARAKAEGQWAFMEAKIALLEEMLRLRRLERFSRRNESLTELQLMLLVQEPSIDKAELDLEASLPEPAKPQRKPHPGRTPLPESLPRQTVTLVCPEEQTRCQVCQAQTQVVGYETSEELSVEPAHYFVRVTRREKRACPHHPECGVATAAAPVKILPKSKLSDEFIIDVMVNKYQWHQPLYRQAAKLEQEAGVSVDRHTLDDGVMWLGELLQTLKEPMRQELFNGHYLQADETPVGVKTPLCKGKLHRGFLFEYSQPRGVVVFDFRMGRGREGPNQFLSGFSGILQCDGYTGYDELSRPGSPVNPAIVRAGCLAHLRRHFFKAHEVDPRETQALGIVEKIGAIYAVEKAAESDTPDPTIRLALRQEKSVGLMTELKTRIEDIQKKVLSRSALGRACKYALGQWERLEVFLRDGRVELDNNWCENGIRPVALGRKNWMLIGSEQAGPKIAAILSIIETCRRLKIDLRTYLMEVLPALAQWPLPPVEQYTPLAWKRKQPAPASES